MTAKMSKAIGLMLTIFLGYLTFYLMQIGKNTLSYIIGSIFAIACYIETSRDDKKKSRIWDSVKLTLSFMILEILLRWRARKRMNEESRDRNPTITLKEDDR